AICTALNVVLVSNAKAMDGGKNFPVEAGYYYEYWPATGQRSGAIFTCAGYLQARQTNNDKALLVYHVYLTGLRDGRNAFGLGVNDYADQQVQEYVAQWCTLSGNMDRHISVGVMDLMHRSGWQSPCDAGSNNAGAINELAKR